MRLNSPQNVGDLLMHCQSLEGMTFLQLAKSLHYSIPTDPLKRKGWIGQALELALGATAGCQAIPDFEALGVELKTLPISSSGKPAESTFVTSIQLLTLHQQTWETSPCYLKLKKILWFLVEGDTRIPFYHRRLGRAFLWSPNTTQETILKSDWIELTNMIILGKLKELDAKWGQYLQVRPKAANSKSLCYGFDENGNKVLTLPRGFYLRSSFTGELIK